MRTGRHLFDFTVKEASSDTRLQNRRCSLRVRPRKIDNMHLIVTKHNLPLQVIVATNSRGQLSRKGPGKGLRRSPWRLSACPSWHHAGSGA